MAKKDSLWSRNLTGKFTAWAKERVQDACSAASAVMKNTKKYSDSVVKMANYANNFGCKESNGEQKQDEMQPRRPFRQTR